MSPRLPETTGTHRTSQGARLLTHGCLALLLALCPPALAETRLNSPFTRIPVMPKDQKKPDKKLKGCDTPPKAIVTLATSSMYDQKDPTRSKKDPEALKRYEAAITPVRDYAQLVTRQANRYVRSGAIKTADAQCTLEWLYAWASKGGLTDLQTPQAVFNMGQLLGGFAMAYLQVRDNPYLAPEKKAVVEKWMQGIARTIQASVMADYVAGRNSARANHRYWSGFGVGATGVVANDMDLFQWGIESARIGLKEIQPDGSMPLEMRRASRARDYHIFAVSPLVMMAELGLANGVNLYEERDGALHRLVNRVLLAYRDPSFFEKATGKRQQPYPEGDDGIPSSRLGWLEPYHLRFPSERTAKILKEKRPVMSTALGGNITDIYTGTNN